MRANHRIISNSCFVEKIISFQFAVNSPPIRRSASSRRFQKEMSMIYFQAIRTTGSALQCVTWIYHHMNNASQSQNYLKLIFRWKIISFQLSPRIRRSANSRRFQKEMSMIYFEAIRTSGSALQYWQ